MKKVHCVFFITLSVSFYLFFALRSVHQFPFGDEIYHLAVADREHVYDAPESVRNFGLWGHPSLYGEALMLFSRILPPTYETARVLGILIFLCTLPVIFFLSLRIAPDKNTGIKAGALSVFLYCAHPMAIQGSLLLDRDNTFFTLFMALFVLSYLAYRTSHQRRDYLCSVVFFALMLWGKLIHLPVVALCVLVFSLLSRRTAASVLNDFSILLYGVILFVGSWFVYCSIFPAEWHRFPDIFLYLVHSGGTRHASSSSTLSHAADMARTFYYVVILMNPFYLGLGFLFFLNTMKTYLKFKKFQERDLFSVFMVVMFFGYIVTGRVMFGFPKYHFPLLFMLCAAAAHVLFDAGRLVVKKHAPLFLFLVLALCILYAGAAGDLYWASYFGVKQSFMESGFLAWDIKLKIMSQWLILGFSAVSTWFILRAFSGENAVSAAALSFLVCGIALSFSQNAVQLRADYSTLSNYGEQGTREALRHIERRRGKDKLALGSFQLLFYLRQLNSKRYTDAFFDSRENVLNELKNESVQFFVYGVNTNTLRQVREVFHGGEVRGYLQKHFTMEKIGTYTVWEKNPP